MKIKSLINIFLVLIYSIFFTYYQAAAEETNKLIKTIPINNPQILKEQAVISYKKGNYQESLNYLEHISPNNINDEILFLTANCYDHLGNPQKAIEHLTESIKTNPKNSYAYYNLGILNSNNGDINEAIGNFNSAIKNNKTFSAAYYNVGVCYYKIKDHKNALKCFKNALKLDSSNSDIYYNLALTYKALNNDAKNKEYLDLYKSALNSKN